MGFERYISNSVVNNKALIDRSWIDLPVLKSHLMSCSIPNEKIEEWKYFNTSKIQKGTWKTFQRISKEYSSVEDTNLKNSVLLVNGIFQHTNLSEDIGIKIYNIANYLEKNPSIKNTIFKNPNKYSEKRISGKIDNNTTAFLSLNALLNKGVVIEVAENNIVNEKINLINIIQDNNLLINPYTLIMCKTGSSLNIVDTTKYEGDNNWINPCIEGYLDDHANLSMLSIQSKTKENITTSSLNFHLSEKAKLNMFVLNRENTKNDIRIFLKKKSSQANINGILISSEKKQSDIFCKIEHHSKDCKSQQNWRLLSADSSTTSVKGKILVKKNSKGSDGKFYSRSLIIGDGASSFSKPELEIFEDEVSCSHGAAFGEIDKNLIFYMQSRGISKNEAIKIIITAFINEIVSNDEEMLETYIAEMQDFFEVNIL